MKRNVSGKLKHEKLTSDDLQECSDIVPNFCLNDITRSIIEGSNNGRGYSFDTEMSKLLKRFKSELNEVVTDKKNFMEEFVEDSIKQTTDKNLIALKENEKENERKVYFLQLQEFKRLNKEFCKDMQHLDLSHSKQYSVVLDEMRKDMTQLQKKLLMETQQKEMGNIRKHLKLPLI
ncbi:UNVERIFIED_CONTAM: hypothetical protein NCL1_51266 [Trichonephila clavipes]